ncbi:MAG: hypothetical protein ACPG08_02510 [Flavobacteriales bacterium]
MRNIALLLPALAFVSSVLGQITITGSDMPQPDVTYPLVNAAITDMSLGEISGADATWDASDLMAVMDAPLTPVDIDDASISAALVFNSPFNSTYQCDFFLPTEFPDLGMDLGIPLDGFNNFYQTDGGAYAIAGIGLSAMGFDLPVTYDDIDEILPLPLEYGASMSSTGAFELDITGVLTYGLTQSREVEVDGWGTLILPSGSYEVLRTRTELAATDDVFIEQLGEPFTIDREQVTYQWWGDGMGFPLLEITEVFGLPLTATFQDLGESSDVAEAAASQAFTPFPNPIDRGQQLRWHTPSVWSLMDGAGRTVSSGQSNRLTILDDAAAGVYTLRTEDGRTARIVVQ